MKKTKLNYRFHNPNSKAESADYILKIMLEANRNKAQMAIQNAVNPTDEKKTESKNINELVT